MTHPLLHIGGASTASVIISLAGIFLLLLIMSFAFWRGPQEERRFSRRWFIEWAKASAPRIIVAAVFCAGLFVASSLSGGSTEATDPAVCNIGQPALTSQPVTDDRLATGITGLRDLAAAAEQGDLDHVQLLLRADTHAITHDVDARIRPLDEALARDLCLSIIFIESESIADNPNIDRIVAEAQRSAELLEQARTLLSGATATPDPFAKPGAGACDSPIGAISDRPITRERIDGAIAKYDAIAAAARQGDTASIAQLFYGDAHDISHDIDGPLRDADLALAQELCLSILTLEIQLAGSYELATIETEAERANGLLADAAAALGTE